MVVVEEVLEPGRIVGHNAGHAQLFRTPEVRLLVEHPQVGRDSSLPAHNSSYNVRGSKTAEKSQARPDPEPSWIRALAQKYISLETL
jgi:hypothetical protein